MKRIFILLFFLTACSSPLKTAQQSPQGLTQVNLIPQKSRAQYEAKGSRYMVSTQGEGATNAAIEVLNRGGNIFDAFTAVSFAIGVERPQSTGIGGGGFLIFYKADEKKVYAFDFRETAPANAHEKMFLDSNNKPDPQLSQKGALSVATPGLVKGVLEIQKKYGKLGLEDVMRPAIRLASEGFTVYPSLHRATVIQQNSLAQFPSSRKIFLDPEGNPWPVGHRFKQIDLANTLTLISKKGSEAFYRGPIAKKIADSILANKGILNVDDLKKYQTKWRNPVQSTYHDFQIFSQPPPSSGGTHVIQILNLVENEGLKKWGPQDPRSIHLTARAMQRAFFDRAQFMGDPDFEEVPTQKLISKSYAQKIRTETPKNKVLKAHELQIQEESPETTHFSIMDADGNMIASTQTINGYFGSALVADGTGIVLNNEMDDFAAQVGAQNLFGAVGGKNNLIAPSKRPLSSMSPTLVLQKGQPYLALGTPSGTRIITCVAQTLLNVLEYDLPLWEAVSLTRYHHQWQPDTLQIETPAFQQGTLQELQAMGYNITEKDLGCRIQIVRKEADQLHGVSDPREEGSSQGL